MSGPKIRISPLEFDMFPKWQNSLPFANWQLIGRVFVEDKLLHFLAHLVFHQTSLCNHDLSVVHSCRPASASSGIGVGVIGICAQPS